MKQVCNVDISSFESVAEVRESAEVEIMKAVVIKILIQIDRSIFLDTKQLYKNLIGWLTIEDQINDIIQNINNLSMKHEEQVVLIMVNLLKYCPHLPVHLSTMLKGNYPWCTSAFALQLLGQLPTRLLPNGLFCPLLVILFWCNSSLLWTTRWLWVLNWLMNW